MDFRKKTPEELLKKKTKQKNGSFEDRIINGSILGGIHR